MKYTPRTVINYVIFTFLFACTAILIADIALPRQSADTYTQSAIADAENQVQIMIDAGHGGEDGGASHGELIEKELNLEIALCLSDIYTLFGYNSSLTRSDDRLLYDHYNDLEDYTGRKKTYDLRNRLRIAEESGAALFVGIHMNKFSIEKYSGLQTYYSPNTEGSNKVATLIQSYARKYLMPENDRSIKSATDAIYILNRIKIPAVLVECGFLSNPYERNLLATNEYKQKLAAVIFASSAEYLASSES